MISSCSIGGCERVHYAKGLCNPHWGRQHKTGSVQANKPIEKRGQKSRLRCVAKRCSEAYHVDGWCKNHYRLVLRRKKKEELVAGFGGACKDCKQAYHDSVFQFHHRVPRYKKFEIGPSLVNKKWSEVLKEAKKCDMLCPTCHALRHAHERDEELGYDY